MPFLDKTGLAHFWNQIIARLNGKAELADVTSSVSSHNVNTSAHNDIRELINGLTSRLNALANSTDVELDQMAELVAYIKNNKNLIDGITTNKVNVTDIINNLTTNVANKPLSSAQGVALKQLIDALGTTDSELIQMMSNLSTNLNNHVTNHAPATAQPNQNAFSNIKVGSTTIAADSTTDTLNLVAGNNITITPDATNDKITIAATSKFLSTDLYGDSLPTSGTTGQIYYKKVVG